MGTFLLGEPKNNLHNNQIGTILER